MQITDGVAILCKESDSIKCTHCRRIALVSDLEKKPGHKFPIASKNGSCHQTRYYYCSCDDPLAKVFDPGDGDALILGANVELVKTEKPV